MLRKLFVIANILFLPFFLFSQNSISFEAIANAKKVAIGNVFDVTFTLKNARGQNFKAPNFSSWQVISGPSSSMSTQIINGRMTQEMGYSYTLMPKKQGRFAIGAATIQVNGKTYKTKPLQVQVIKGKNVSSLQGTNKEAFVRAEPNVSEAYIGQQVLVDYKLYTVVNIENYQTVAEPEYDGFFAQNIRRFNSAVNQEVIDGVQYTTKVLKRVALYPQQAGIITIEPLRMQLGIEIPGQRSNGFFFRKKTRAVFVNTDPVEIQVKKLPNNPPISFNGAVGDYRLQSTVTPNSVTTDDAVTVRMRIQGNGDLKRLQAPNLVVPTMFEVYDPTVLQEDLNENQGEFKGTKTFEWLILPKQTGQFIIAPEFTYFNPDSLKYITLKGRSSRVNVGKGTGTSNTNAAQSKKEVQTDIRFIKLETSLHKRNSSFFGSILFWILAVLPLLGLLGVMLYRQVLSNQGDMDLTMLKSKQASKIAQQKLSTAKKHLLEGNSKGFYDEVSRASLGYVSDKLNIPNSQLSKNNVREKLTSLNVSLPNIEAFMKILQTCEMALFAGMDNSAAMQEIYQKAIEVIEKIEEEL